MEEQKYFAGGLVALYAYYFRYCLLVDIAIGPLYVLFGYFIVPFVLGWFSMYDLIMTQYIGTYCFLVLNIADYLVRRSANTPNEALSIKFRQSVRLSVLVAILCGFYHIYNFSFETPNILAAVGYFIAYLGGVYTFGGLFTLTKSCLNFETSTILYILCRAHLGYTELDHWAERIIYELPLLYIHYVRFYRKSSTKGGGGQSVVGGVGQTDPIGGAEPRVQVQGNSRFRRGNRYKSIKLKGSRYVLQPVLCE